MIFRDFWPKFCDAVEEVEEGCVRMESKRREVASAEERRGMDVCVEEQEEEED